ncbi:MAG: SIMPL domain-containing protein [Litorimonas sp.]
MSSAVTRAGKYAALWIGTSLFAACSPQNGTDQVTLDLGDIEDYYDFLEERGDIVEPVPFEPEPLFVSAVGKVQAKPDIAVITAKISAEDKNESRAVDEMGQIINAVQTALAGRDIETGFTAINSSREFDQRCRNENSFARQRHNQIRGDYYFNKRLNDKGDTETKRRDPKPRVAQQVCFAQKIKVSTNMVIRIEPADAAGDVLRALSDAGAENSRLYGYDFANYDALYQEAAAKAVTLAREKANVVARKAGGTLGDIESFSVSAPERTGRFGPQPNVIRPANRYRGEDGSVIDRYVGENENYGTRRRENVTGREQYDEIIVTARKTNRSPAVAFAPPPPPQLAFAQEASTQIIRGWDGSVQEAVGTTNTNALSISLLSGPQTISVTAQLGYTYDTPLNGKIIILPDEG